MSTRCTRAEELAVIEASKKWQAAYEKARGSAVVARSNLAGYKQLLADSEAKAEALAEAATEVERLFHLPDWEYTEAEGGAAFMALRAALARYRGEK